MLSLKDSSFVTFAERGWDLIKDPGLCGEPVGENVDMNTFWTNRYNLLTHLTSEHYPDQGIFVYDDYNNSKLFCVDITTAADYGTAMHFVINVFNERFRDMALMVGSFLRAPMPAARMLVGHGCGALEQDILGWYLQQASAANCLVGNIADLKRRFDATNILKAFPWLSDYDNRLLLPEDFWLEVYTGCGMKQNTDADYVTGGRIREDLFNYGLNKLASWESERFYVSVCLPKYQFVKVECNAAVFSSKVLEDSIKITHAINRAWIIRFAVYEDLLKPNSYLGGVIALPDGKLLLEVGT